MQQRLQSRGNETNSAREVSEAWMEEKISFLDAIRADIEEVSPRLLLLLALITLVARCFFFSRRLLVSSLFSLLTPCRSSRWTASCGGCRSWCSSSLTRSCEWPRRRAGNEMRAVRRWRACSPWTGSSLYSASSWLGSDRLRSSRSSVCSRSTQSYEHVNQGEEEEGNEVGEGGREGGRGVTGQ
eukprot:79628-Hanusia_phi.AAC.2